MSLRVTVEATTEPVTLAEAKAFARVETTYEDAVIPSLITAARKVAENMTHRALARQTFEKVMDEFPCDDDFILIPMPPLSTTSSDVVITYIDSSAAVQTLASTAYTIDCKSEPARIYCSTGNDWPDTNDVRNAVSITFAAGYASNSSVTHACPANAQTWIKMRVAGMIEHREPIVTGEALTNLRRDYVDGLLDDLRIPEI